MSFLGQQFYHSTLYQHLLIIKFLVELWCYFPWRWIIKWVYAFFIDICFKVNVIAPVDFELVYCNNIIHFFSHNAPLS